jgi:hypothetical protein
MNKFKSSTSFRFGINTIQQQNFELVHHHRNHLHKIHCDATHDDIEECKVMEEIIPVIVIEEVIVPVIEVIPEVDIIDIYQKEEIIETKVMTDVVKLNRRSLSFKKVVNQAMDSFILKKQVWN